MTLAHEYAAGHLEAAAPLLRKTFLLSYCTRICVWRLPHPGANGIALQFSDGSVCEVWRDSDATGRSHFRSYKEYRSWVTYLAKPTSGQRISEKAGGEVTEVDGDSLMRVLQALPPVGRRRL